MAIASRQLWNVALTTNGLSSNHLSLSDQKKLFHHVNCDLSASDQSNQVIFTSAPSLKLTASSSGFCVRKRKSLSSYSLCGNAQSPRQLVSSSSVCFRYPLKGWSSETWASSNKLSSTCKPPPRHLAYVSGEGTRQKLLSLSLLMFPCVSPMLEVSESTLQVLDIIL